MESVKAQIARLVQHLKLVLTQDEPAAPHP